MFSNLLRSLGGSREKPQFVDKEDELSIKEYAEVIKEGLKMSGIEEKPDKVQGDFTSWILRKGSLTIFLRLYFSDEHDCIVFDARGPLVKLPEVGVSELMSMCMQINNILIAASLTHDEELGILITSTRFAAGLDAKEVEQIIYNVAYVGDYMDTKLAQEFDVEMYGEDEE